MTPQRDLGLKGQLTLTQSLSGRRNSHSCRLDRDEIHDRN
jgi:hypothetical protein